MRTYFLLSLIIPAFICCKKAKNDPVIHADSQPRGTIYGKVSHYDNDGAEYLRSRHTTTVMLDGLSSTTTDTLGNYTFKGIPAGKYSLTFLKPGTGFFRKYEVLLNPDTEVKLDVALADTAAWTITRIDLSDTLIDDQLFMMINFMVPAVNQQRYVQVYFSHTNNPNAKIPASFQETTTFILPVQQATSTIPFAYSILKEKGFKKDSLVFARFYPVNPNCLYWDQPTNQTICSGTGSPYPTFTLTMP